MAGKKNSRHESIANITIDTNELEYWKSCSDKLRDIAAIINEKQGKNEKKKSPEDKLKEIKKIIKGQHGL